MPRQKAAEKPKPQPTRSRPRPLRGETLAKAARLELNRMVNLAPQSDPINVKNLAARLGVTRQAIYNNGIDKLIPEYADQQRKHFSLSVQASVQRRPLEARIATLEKENQELRQKLDGLVEKWATITYNAKMRGIEIDLLLTPMPLPQRKEQLFTTRRQRD